MTKPRGNKQKLKFIIFGVSMMAISFLHFAVFWVYINFDTIKSSFYEFDKIASVDKFVGLENYKEWFDYIFIEKRPSSSKMFWNTFKAIYINLIILPIAVVAAYSFYKKIYAEKFFRVIFYVPTIISIVVQVTAFMAMFDTDYGMWSGFLEKLGIHPEGGWTNKETNSALWFIIYFFSIITGLGTNVVLMSSAMLRIPTSVTEALELDGCGYYRELFSVTLPLIMPTITTWMTAILTSVFGFMMAPMLMAYEPMGGEYDTVPWNIYRATIGLQNGADPNVGYEAAALGIMLSVFIMPIVYLMRFVFNKLTPNVSF